MIVSGVKILFSDLLFRVAIFSAIALTTSGIIFRYYITGDNIIEPTQTVLISLTITIYSYLVGAIMKLVYNSIKYSKLNGSYKGYAYKSTDKYQPIDYYTREFKSQSSGRLIYKGGDNFLFKVDAKVVNSELTWTGDMKMISSNMAEIAWWYDNDHLRDSVGYKRAVVTDDGTDIKITLFSNDDSIHGRELFVKDIN